MIVMGRMLPTLLLAVVLCGAGTPQASRAESASDNANAIRIGARAEPTKLIYFPPYDAPFATDGYAARIDSILEAVSPSGDVSFLIEPATETYSRLIRSAEVEDFALSKRGRQLLRDNREWLIDAKRAPQPGYRKFLAAHARAVDAASLGNADDFREAVIALFGEADAYDYVGALQVERTYGSQPRATILRSIKRRTIGEGQRGGHLYYPHPDDLDLVSKWRPLILRSDDDPRLVEGLITEVEVFLPGIDRVLEQVSAARESEPFYVPRRLFFCKDLQLQQTPAGGAAARADAMSVPGNWLDIYASSLSRQPSVMFLFAIELERVLQ